MKCKDRSKSPSRDFFVERY